MSAPETESHAGRQFLGGCLIAVGLLIATVCGACTLLVSAAAVMSSFDSHAQGTLALVLISLAFAGVVGGTPTAIGIGLVVIGWRLIRRPRPIAPPENTFV
jgi:hypothetical protein